MTVDIEATGQALGLLFAQTLVQLAAGNVPMPLAGVVREQGAERFDIDVVPDGDLESALRRSAKPEVREAAWLGVTDDDDEQTISMYLCVIPLADPPFSVIVRVPFDDDGDELVVGNPTMMVPEGSNDTLPDELWPAINRGMSQHDGLRDAPIVFGERKE